MINISTSLRNELLANSNVATIFASSTINIYTGTQPDSPDDAATGDLLLSISGISFETSARDGTLQKPSGEEWLGSVLRSGTAGWFRIVAISGESLDGSVGDSGNMQFDSYSWAAGDSKSIDYAAILMPTAVSATVSFDSNFLLTSSLSIRVGPGEDYTTLASAFEFLSGHKPLFDSTTAVSGLITLSSSFAFSGVTELHGGIDLSWVKIVSESASVTGGGGIAITGGSRGPEIGFYGPGVNFYAYGAGSTIKFSSGSGGNFIACSGRVSVQASSAKFDSLVAELGAVVDVTSADISGSSSQAIIANDKSSVFASSADLSSSGGVLCSNGSSVFASSADLSSSGGVLCSNKSFVDLTGATMTDCTSYTATIQCLNESNIVADDADLTNSLNGKYVFATEFSKVMLHDATLGGTCGDAISTGIQAVESSTIILKNVTMGTSAGIAIYSLSRVVGIGTCSALFLKAYNGSAADFNSLSIDSTGYSSSGGSVSSTNGSLVIVNTLSIPNISNYGLYAESESKIKIDTLSLAFSGSSFNALLFATDNSEILSKSTSFSGNLDEVYGSTYLEAWYGSKITACYASQTLSAGTFAQAVSSNYGSTVICSGAGLGGNKIGIIATYGSYVMAAESDFSECVTLGVSCSEGSTVNIVEGTAIRTDRSSGPPYDLEIETGSTINASNASGLASTTVNTLSADGIIYQ